MMRPGRWLPGVVARAFEPAERDVVLGDVAESGQGICSAIWDLLGLIVRRQVGLWAVWRPWLALLGVSAIAGLQLSGIAFRLDVDLGQQLMAHHHGVRFETGLTAGQDMAFLVCLALGLMVWSWTCGSALGSLSGRAVWVTWSVFDLAVLDSRTARFVLSRNIILRNAPFRLLMAATLPQYRRPSVLSPGYFGSAYGRAPAGFAGAPCIPPWLSGDRSYDSDDVDDGLV